MGLRQRAWARQVRDRIVNELGGKCKDCGTDVKKLCLHHVEGKSWVSNKLEWSHRISIIQREHTQGLIDLLCIGCNNRRGDPSAWLDFLNDPERPDTDHLVDSLPLKLSDKDDEPF